MHYLCTSLRHWSILLPYTLGSLYGLLQVWTHLIDTFYLLSRLRTTAACFTCVFPRRVLSLHTWVFSASVNTYRKINLSFCFPSQLQLVLPVHFLGAFLLFTPGSIYGFLQAWISYKMQPGHTPLIVCHIRLVLSIIIAVFFLLCILCINPIEDKSRVFWGWGLWEVCIH